MRNSLFLNGPLALEHGINKNGCQIIRPYPSDITDNHKILQPETWSSSLAKMESAVMDVSRLLYLLVLCVHAWYQRSLAYNSLFLGGIFNSTVLAYGLFLLNDSHNILAHRSHIISDGN